MGVVCWVHQRMASVEFDENSRLENSVPSILRALQLPQHPRKFTIGVLYRGSMTPLKLTKTFRDLGLNDGDHLVISIQESTEFQKLAASGLSEISPRSSEFSRVVTRASIPSLDNPELTQLKRDLNELRVTVQSLKDKGELSENALQAVTSVYIDMYLTARVREPIGLARADDRHPVLDHRSDPGVDRPFDAEDPVMRT